jgi:hypothetical protein
VRRGNQWQEQAKLTADDGIGGDNFGIRVAVDGDTAVVGAWFDARGINLNQGSAYVFTRNPAGAWSQRTKLLAEDGIAGDWFGIATAISGDTIAIGARQDNLTPNVPGSSTGSGSVYVYTGEGSTWKLQRKLSASDAAAGAAFGETVEIEGDRILVGAVFDGGKGAVYLFSRTGISWAEQYKFTIADGKNSDYFGDFVAINGPTIVASAYGWDISSKNSVGTVYVFSSFLREGSIEPTVSTKPNELDLSWQATAAFPDAVSILEISDSPTGPWTQAQGNPTLSLTRVVSDTGIVTIRLSFVGPPPLNKYFRLHPTAG